MRNIQEDKVKIAEYWDMEVLDDGEQIADILTIAESAIERAILAETERDKFRIEAKNERELSESIVAEREKLYLQLEEMQKTLEWYADEKNYKMNSAENDDFLSYTIEPAVIDRGERARQALKGESQ